MKKIIIILILALSLSGLQAQKLIHELPEKTTIDTNYLIFQGNPNTGKLYKTKMSKIAALAGGGSSVDTTSLSNRINLKLNASDTAGLSNRIDLKLNKSDTSGLSNRIDLKLNKSDTSGLSNRIDLKLNKSDTSGLSNRIDLKLNKSDTSGLSNRINQKQNSITTGTTGQYLRGDLSLATFPTIPAQFNPIAGSNVTITGTYPDMTFASSGGGGGGGAKNYHLSISVNNENVNPQYTVLASAVLRPVGDFTNGTSINWEILDATDHTSSFFTGAVASGNTIRVSHPKVKRVMNVTITPDEILAKQALIVGSSAALSFFDAYPYVNKSLTVRIVGTADVTLDKAVYPSELSSLFDYPTFNTSTHILSITHIGGYLSLDLTQNMKAAMLVYNGSNRLSIKRIYSGVASDELQYYVYDASGSLLSSYPAVGDEFILNLGNGTIPVMCDTWYTNYMSKMWSSSSNFWATGLYEAWMVINQSDVASNIINWQTDYPSATNYKIYRSTSPNYTNNSVSGMTLIHTGTSGEFTDSGLTSGTLYYYKLMATVGSDVEVTTFNCKAL